MVLVALAAAANAVLGRVSAADVSDVGTEIRRNGRLHQLLSLAHPRNLLEWFLSSETLMSTGPLSSDVLAFQFAIRTTWLHLR